MNRTNLWALTFCSLFTSSAFAVPKINSVLLKKFQETAEVTKAIPFENEKVCDVNYENLHVASSNPEEVMDELIAKQNLKKVDLMESRDFFSTTGFKNVKEVLDNSYCFPFLGGKINDSEQRKNLLNSYNEIASKVKLYLYYSEDVSSSSPKSEIYMFIKDPDSTHIYAVKSTQKLE
jgi:hypothetical protein